MGAHIVFPVTLSSVAKPEIIVRRNHMAKVQVKNWFGDLVSHPKVVVEAKSVKDIIRVLKNPAKYPSPVRAVGSNHSTARCGVADGGTAIKITSSTDIVRIC
jgi:FAD/FMN-containing dehydrogenase